MDFFINKVLPYLVGGAIGLMLWVLIYLMFFV